MADYTGEDWKSTATNAWLTKTLASAEVAGKDWLPTVKITWLNKSFVGATLDADLWTAALVYFKMRGMSASSPGTYATWIVSGQPDWTASRYTGALPTPLQDVCVVATWRG